MKYYLHTIGCQMNYSDAERISAILDAHGCRKTASEKQADCIIIISCSVRQKAMDRIFGKLKAWRAARKQRGVKIILTGCVLPADKNKLQKEFDAILPIKDIQSLPKLLNLRPYDAQQGTVTNADYLMLDSKHSSPFQAFVPIMTGCNNYCTYCAVPYTRGEEASRPSSEIITEVKSLLKKGYKEITLLGQNVNAYIDPEVQHDTATLKSRMRNTWEFKKNQPIQFRSATTNVPKDFANLLKKINALPGNFWIRFLTSNPQDVSDELIATLPTCNKVTRYFHLPIQAGDDEILRRMNRRHTRDYYLQLIDKIRTAWPGVTITTDMIVGFPGETKEQFQKTVELMKIVKYDMAYLAEYSPRPGTAAQKFFKDNVTKREKTRRKNELNTILKQTALANNKRLLKKKVRVLVDSYNPKTKTNHGRTEQFHNIQFKGPKKTGTFVTCTITKATAWALEGTLVQ